MAISVESLNILKTAMGSNASDLYMVAGMPPTIKVSGRHTSHGSQKNTKEDTERFLQSLYSVMGRSIDKLKNGLDDDFSLHLSGIGRFRVNAYYQNDSYACVLRTIPSSIPDFNKLNIPNVIIELANLTRGLVLFTGTTGSGKTTSLACLIDKINREKSLHIVTIEDPIEFTHKGIKSIISHREVERDTKSFASALRASLRQAPDVILVGEMRDQETISTAITAAETGHLVFSTLHTMGAAATVDRIIDVFPAGQQNQIRTQLAMCLMAVVTQQLLPTLDGKVAPAFEIMITNVAIRNLIRENKIFQIDNILQTSIQKGMKTMDMSIKDMLVRGMITKEQAASACINPQMVFGAAAV